MALNTIPPAGNPRTGEQLAVVIERFAAQGRTVAHLAGMAVLVERGVPGERAVVEIERAESRYALARVVSVENPSPDRVPAPCPHFDACGGCDWQHLRYEAQLALKRQVAQEQLGRIGKVSAPADWAVVPAPAPLEYRDKLELAPFRGPAGWQVGTHGRGTDAIVPIDRCWLAPAVYSELAKAAVVELAAMADALPLSVARVTVQGGQGPDGAEHWGVTLHVRKPDQMEPLAVQGERLLKALRTRFPGVSGLAAAVGAREEDPGRVRVIAGAGTLTKTVAPFRYSVPFGAFFQVHPAQASALAEYVVAEMLREVPPEDRAPRLLDLFCGAGLFTLPLLARGYRALGAENSRPALEAAREAAQAAGLAADFVPADLDGPHALRKLMQRHGHPEGVVVDPPRRGLAARLAADLAAAAPAAIVYVSCDPGTFARDAARLAPKYELAALRGFDFFPQTHHLELVGTFRLRRG